jgi:hypothetical protein
MMDWWVEYKIIYFVYHNEIAVTSKTRTMIANADPAIIFFDHPSLGFSE